MTNQTTNIPDEIIEKLNKQPSYTLCTDAGSFQVVHLDGYVFVGVRHDSLTPYTWHQMFQKSAKELATALTVR